MPLPHVCALHRGGAARAEGLRQRRGGALLLLPPEQPLLQLGEVRRRQRVAQLSDPPLTRRHQAEHALPPRPFPLPSASLAASRRAARVVRGSKRPEEVAHALRVEEREPRRGLRPQGPAGDRVEEGGFFVRLLREGQRERAHLERLEGPHALTSLAAGSEQLQAALGCRVKHGGRPKQEPREGPHQTGNLLRAHAAREARRHRSCRREEPPSLLPVRGRAVAAAVDLCEAGERVCELTVAV